jgi:glycosyltransferase involved in cell wall biosynthesis
MTSGTSHHLVKRAGILFSDFGPYHVARIEALREALGQEGVGLVAFRFTKRSDDYGWAPEDPKGVLVITLAQSKPTSALEAFKMAAAFCRELRERKVDAVFLPTYSPLPNFLCFLAAKLAGCRTILMTESWHGTEGASLPGKLIKHVLVRMFDSALVGGGPQRDYVVAYGMPSEKVFTGYDVIDVAHFSARADKVRSMVHGAGSIEREPGGVAPLPHAEDVLMRSLPKRYFLNLGRFVEKKNLATLVAAFGRYSDKAGRQAPASLVLVGEGPLRGDLEGRARELRMAVRDGVADPKPSGGAEVVFYPFQQAEVTPLFFARCEAFVLPSTREEWGLVVNEAMACGVPVIVSNRVGSHFDLVQEGVNGFSFDPGRVGDLADLLGRFEVDEDLRGRLGAAGRRLIEEWKPSRFGEGGVGAMKAAFTRN